MITRFDTSVLISDWKRKCRIGELMGNVQSYHSWTIKSRGIHRRAKTWVICILAKRYTKSNSLHSGQ